MGTGFTSSILGPYAESEKTCLLKLGTLICAGVKTPEALVIVGDEGSPFSDTFKVFAARMKPGNGKYLWEILGSEASEFSSFVPCLIQVGEETKHLGAVLIDASDIIAGIQNTLPKQLVDSNHVLSGISYYAWALLKNTAPNDTERIHRVLAECVPFRRIIFRDIFEQLKTGKSLADIVQNRGFSGVEESVLSLGKIAHLTDSGLNGLANFFLKEAIGVRLDAIKVKR